MTRNICYTAHISHCTHFTRYNPWQQYIFTVSNMHNSHVNLLKINQMSDFKTKRTLSLHKRNITSIQIDLIKNTNT